jgi:hypothetical protein
VPLSGTHAPLSLEALIRRSGLIFIGTVERLRATTIDAVSATDLTAIVRVEGQIESPQTVRPYEGREVTLLQGEPAHLAVGQRLVFFATGWLYGTGVAVREIGTREVQGDDAATRTEVRAAIERVGDEDIQQRLRAAKLIVRGRVEFVNPLPADPSSRGQRELEWWEAILGVEGVERGIPPKGRIAVIFPKSDDPPWRSAPKFHVGQRGIWVLDAAKLEGLRRQSFTALDPLDFQSIEELDRIRRLLGPSS